MWPLAALFVATAGLAFLIATAHGLHDYKGRPLGTDFSSFYAAGTYAREGRPRAPFDAAAQRAREQAIFGDDVNFYSFLYPPFFLLIVATLATMPYLPALAVWQGVTLVLYLWMVKAVLDRFPATSATPFLPYLLALAFPAVFINLIHGQNGFVTASLLGGALATLDRRPVASRITLGLLAYKPQFGLIIPVALVAGAHWRAFAAAVVTIILLVVTTLIVFGPDTWQAFFASSSFARVVLLEMGAGGWPRS